MVVLADGLSSFTPYLDLVLLPALVIMIVLTIVSYLRWRKSVKNNCYVRKTEGMGIVKDLICYCFEYSVDDINQDYLENGKSTIMEKIQMEKKFGNCQCATKNPRGK